MEAYHPGAPRAFDNTAGNEEEQVGLLEPSEVFDDALDPTMRQHNENRVSEVICLLPGFESKLISNASKLKTRMCNKWELTGWCPFGDKCHFAHGSAELRGCDGQLLKTEAGNSAICNAKQTALPAKASIGGVDGGVTCVPRSHYAGAPSRRLPNMAQKKEEIPTRIWKGPNKISKIYGDWIDDL